VSGTEQEGRICEKKLRILIADGHPAVRRALIKLINQSNNFAVCLEADNVPEALETLNKQHVDMAIADISLKNQHTGALAEKIRLQCPSLPVLILSMEDEALYAESVSVTDQKEYIVKKNATQKITKAIQYIQTLLNNRFLGFTVLVSIDSGTINDTGFKHKELSGYR